MFMQIYTYLLTYLSKLVIIHIETGMHSKVGTALGCMVNSADPFSLLCKMHSKDAQ